MTEETGKKAEDIIDWVFISICIVGAAVQGFALGTVCMNGDWVGIVCVSIIAIVSFAVPYCYVGWGFVDAIKEVLGKVGNAVGYIPALVVLLVNLPRIIVHCLRRSPAANFAIKNKFIEVEIKQDTEGTDPDAE